MSKKSLPTMRLRRRARLEDDTERRLRSKRVSRGMEIIGNAANRTEVEAAIIRHDTEIPTRRSADRYWVKNKAQKLAAQKMEAALRRLKATMNDADLPPVINADFPLDEQKFEEWLTLLNRMATTKLDNVGNVNLPAYHAVAAAAEFLNQHSVPLTKYRNGKLCRLAEVFYGRSDAKLYPYCLNFLGQSRD